MAKTNYYAGQKLDTGLGLIMRLQNLLRDIDYFSKKGDLNNWDLNLAIIFRNIMHKAEMVFEEGNKESLGSIKLKGDHTEKYARFTKLIQAVKKEIKTTKKAEDWEKMRKAQNDYYEILFKKDMWIRQVLQEENLYKMEVEYDPFHAASSNY